MSDAATGAVETTATTTTTAQTDGTSPETTITPNPEAEASLLTPPAPVPFDAATFAYPEGLTFSDEQKTGLAEMAKKHNISTGAMTDLIGMYQAELKAAADKSLKDTQSAWTTMTTAWQNEAKAKFGDQLEPVLARSNGVLTEFGAPELFDALRMTGLGNNPHLISFLDKVAQAMGEAKPATGASQAARGDANLAAMYPSMAHLNK